MKQARVTAFELDDDGGKLFAVGTALTDDEGGYDFRLSDNYSGGAISLEISVTPDTRMRCDAVSGCADQASGADVQLPADFKLQAILDGGRKAGDKVSASVSPWTTMAAQRVAALVKGGEQFDRANKRANAETSQILGFDITRTRAQDISQVNKESSPEESQYAVMNAVVAELLFKDAGKDMTARLGQFSKIMDDGKIDSNDDITTADIASSITAVRSSDKVRSKLSDKANASLDQNNAKFDNDSVEPEIDEDLIVDEGATQAEKIEAYKKFVSQVRTWASSIEQLNEDELTTALEVDLEAVSATFDDETLNQIQLVGELLAQVSEHIATDPESVKTAAADGTVIDIPVKGLDGVTEYGSIKLTPSDNNGLTLVLNGAVTPADGTGFVPFDLVLATSVPLDAIDFEGMLLRSLGQDTSITLAGTITDGEGHQITFNETGVKVALREAVNYTADNQAQTEAALGAAFLRADFNGQVTVTSPKASFDGTAGFELVRLEGRAPLVANAPVSLKRAHISGDFTSGGSQFNAAATLNISNAAKFDTLGWLEFSGDSRNVEFQLSDDVLPPSVTANMQAGSFWLQSRGEDGVNVHVSKFNEDGPVSNTYYVDAVQRQLLVEKLLTATKTELIGKQLRGSNLSGQEETVTLTAEHLSSLSIQFASMYDYPLTVTLSTDEFPDVGLQWPSIDAENVYSYIDEFGYAEFGVEAQSSESYLFDLLPSQATKINHFYYDVQYADDQSAAISYQMPASFDLYTECLAAPAELNAYISGQTPYWSQGDCAYLTLSSESGQYQYTPLEEQNLHLAINEALNARFGHPDVTIDAYSGLNAHGWFENGELETDYEVSVQFADIETDSYFLQGSITVSAGVKIPELPGAALTATISRASRNGGSIAADVTWDGGAYKVRADSVDVTNYAGGTDVVFSNSQGYSLNLVLSEDVDGGLDVIGEAFLDDSKVGTIEMRKGIPFIIYTNGDETQFESLL